MDARSKRRLVIVMICAMALLVGGVMQVHATEKSDGKNMKKVLKYYKQGNYSKAKKYAKKQARKASEACVANMPSDMKAAYQKKVKSYVMKYGLEIGSGRAYVWDYFLSDVDNDKKADLIIELGSCEADVRILVFRYKDGKAKKLGKAYCSHTSFHAYPKHKGIVLLNGHMGGEGLSVVSLKDGKLKIKSYGGRSVGSGKYLSLGCQLKSHVSYDSNYRASISYKDLQ